MTSPHNLFLPTTMHLYIAKNNPGVPASLVVMLLFCTGCSGRHLNVESPAGRFAVDPESTAPLETRGGNGAGYQPQFSGQTRAPGIRKTVAIDVAVVTQQLNMPWAMEPLPDGRFLVTERTGVLRLLSPDGKRMAAVAGVPAVRAQGQAGLHDIALDPDFATNGMIYLSYTETRPGGCSETLARARLVSEGEGASLADLQVLFRELPVIESEREIGSRIVVGGDGKLYLALGERGEPETKGYPQDLRTHFGKVVRLNRDGSVPADNPFVGRSDASPEVWTLGHRNIQAAARDSATGKLWVIEHGPRGGDELNLLKAGANYGWPIISYGIDYSGKPVGAGITQKAGMEQPVYYWDPVIAPSGMIVYRGKLFPQWQGSIFVGGLTGLKLVRLQMDGERVVGEEWLLADQNKRVRDVQQDAAGAVYVLMEDGANSQLLKLTPRPGAGNRAVQSIIRMPQRGMKQRG